MSEVEAETVERGTPVSRKARLRQGLLVGARKGWSSFLWVAKVIVPVSLLVALVEWTGWLYRADAVLGPVMGFLHLPSEAALPIVSGLVINIYAAIATMSVLPFTAGQMTLIAVFCLIAHNLIAEGLIQHRSGMNAAATTLVRVGAAVVTVLAMAPFLGDTSESVAGLSGLGADEPVTEVLMAWGLETLVLLGKVFLIIMAIMMALECLASLGWTEYLYRASRPVMRLLGLSSRTAMLWVTAVGFGLMYGGAAIQEGAGRGELTKGELERLHISIGINHSMVEDPALFLALGLNGFWLWVPKLVMAAAAAHLYRAVEYALRKSGVRRAMQD